MNQETSNVESAPAVAVQRLVQALALLIAEQYALGRRAHGEWVGEMKATLTAKEWAECNWQSFTAEASAFCSLNSSSTEKFL